MSYAWLQSFKTSNERKSIFLIILFPVFLFVICLLAITLFATNENYNMYHKFNEGLAMTGQIFIILLPIIAIWWVISFFFQRQIIFKFTGATPLERKDNPELYNIVETLCISRWLPVPKIWIIPVHTMNAFATGWRAQDSRICLTQWLIEKLNKAELEAVIAHELTHLINKDCLLMLVSIVYIGIIAIIWEILIRVSSSSKDWKNGNILPLIWLVCLLLWYIIYPLVKLALSRKREFLADAWSVELTKNPDAMIAALRKISTFSAVPTAKKQMAGFFIVSPMWEAVQASNFQKSSSWSWAHNDKTKKSSIWDTHPSIDERIAVLENI